MTGIVQAQADRHIWIIFDNYGLMILPFLIYLVAAIAETNRAPFDLPEAESELVAGFMTEFSGFRWALYFLAEYANIFIISAVAVTLFWGGWLRPFPSVVWLRFPAQRAVPVSGARRDWSVLLPDGAAAAQPAARAVPDVRRRVPGPARSAVPDPGGQRRSSQPVLVLSQGLADRLLDDLVPRHLAAIPLRPIDEHRLVPPDPPRHGRRFGQRGGGNAQTLASGPGLSAYSRRW